MKTLKVLRFQNNKKETGYFEALEWEFGMNKFANLHRSVQRRSGFVVVWFFESFELLTPPG